jgi:hypothetical protein
MPESDVKQIAREVPDWVTEARSKYVLRIRDWLIQSWEVTRSPHRFMSEWAQGKREALNPLRFAAVGGALSYLLRWAASRILGEPKPLEGLARWNTSSWGRFALVIVVAAVFHPLLALRSKAPFRATLAAVAFALAGPAVFLSFAVYAVLVACWYLKFGTPWDVRVLFCASWAKLAWAAFAVAGAHRANSGGPLWRSLLPSLLNWR